MSGTIRISICLLGGLACLLGGAYPVTADERAAFAIPNDLGGKLLAELLTPPVEMAAPTARRGPRSLPTPAGLERPEIALPKATVRLPDLPRPARFAAGHPSRLPLPREELAPLAARAPVAPRLQAGPRSRAPAPNFTQMPPLPFLSRPSFDRVPLDDPTAELSSAAALATALPTRTAPAPFLRLNLPDPFENAAAVRLKALPAERAP